MMSKTIAALCALTLTLPAFAADPLTVQEYMATLRPVPADARISYGPAPSQWIDVYRAKASGSRPVVVLIHGGCWQASAPAIGMSQIAADLAANGVTVMNVEYRRIGEPGGGYPGMYQDIGAALDALPAQARRFDLDLRRLVVVGHSSGGHLALWAGSRAKLPADSPFRVASPLPVRTVVSIAGVGNLKYHADLLPLACGSEPKLEQVVGPSSEARKDPFADTAPRAMLPTGVRTLSITGAYDAEVPPYVGQTWRKVARRMGDEAEDVVLPDAGHFDVVAVGSPTWPLVRARILAEVAALK